MGKRRVVGERVRLGGPFGVGQDDSMEAGG